MRDDSHGALHGGLPRIILVEDDFRLAAALCTYLSRYGLSITHVDHGEVALQQIREQDPDLVLLDLMLPGMDGLSICRNLRPDYRGKILFLTASEDDMDQVAALEMGADDYVVKPVQPRVLLARIRVLLRRLEEACQAVDESPSETAANPRPVFEGQPAMGAWQASDAQPAGGMRIGELELDPVRRRGHWQGEDLRLSTQDFDLLWELATHPDEVMSREVLVKAIRGIDYDGLDRTIDNRIAGLRRKLGDDPALPGKLITVRGRGYLLAVDGFLRRPVPDSQRS